MLLVDLIGTKRCIGSPKLGISPHFASLGLFGKDPRRSDLKRNQCKLCIKKYNNLPEAKASVRRYQKTPKGRAAKRKADHKYYRTPEGKAVNKANRRAWRKTAKGKAADKRQGQKYFKTPKGKAARRRGHQVLKTKLGNNLRKRRAKALIEKTKPASTIALLGCNINQFRLHLESQFWPGMSWENYGYGWHVDEIIPCSSFDLKQEDQILACFHYSNSQPLWKELNQWKSDRILTQEELAYLANLKAQGWMPDRIRIGQSTKEVANAA